MATFTAAAAQAGVQPKGLRVGLVGVRSTYSITNTLSTGDVFQMVKVPAGATPLFIQFGGTNGTPSYLMLVGDDISQSRYRSYATYSAAGGTILAYANLSNAVAPYTYSTDDTIDIFISTVTASNASNGGVFYMTAIFSMDAGPL